MNKKYIPGVIVVEGSHDASKLSLIYDTVFVITNGYDIPKEEINFLKALKDNIQIIVLTDLDEAGKKIRERLNQTKSNLTNIEINAPASSKKKGVAECLIVDIENSLDKYVSKKIIKKGIDLYKLGLIGQNNSKELRSYIANRFNLGLVNKSNMIKRMELLEITEQDVMDVIKDATGK